MISGQLVTFHLLPFTKSPSVNGGFSFPRLRKQAWQIASYHLRCYSASCGRGVQTKSLHVTFGDWGNFIRAFAQASLAAFVSVFLFQ